MSDTMQIVGQTRYAILHEPILRAVGIPPACKTLFGLLVLYGGPDRSAWPGLGRLCADLGSSKPAVIGWLRALESAGWLTVERHAGVGSHYQVNYDVAMSAAQPEPVTPKDPATGKESLPHQERKFTATGKESLPVISQENTPRNISLPAGAKDWNDEQLSQAAEVVAIGGGPQENRLLKALALYDPVPALEALREWEERLGAERPRAADRVTSVIRWLENCEGQPRKSRFPIPIDQPRQSSEPPNLVEGDGIGERIWNDAMRDLWPQHLQKRLSRRLTCPEMFETRYLGYDVRTMTLSIGVSHRGEATIVIEPVLRRGLRDIGEQHVVIRSVVPGEELAS